jgi:hypothetical protein
MTITARDEILAAAEQHGWAVELHYSIHLRLAQDDRVIHVLCTDDGHAVRVWREMTWVFDADKRAAVLAELTR